MLVVNKKEILREHFSKLGKKGGPKGGKARMANLTDDERKNLASKAATARWAKEKPAVKATKKAARKQKPAVEKGE